MAQSKKRSANRPLAPRCMRAELDDGSCAALIILFARETSRWRLFRLEGTLRWRASRDRRARRAPSIQGARTRCSACRAMHPPTAKLCCVDDWQVRLPDHQKGTGLATKRPVTPLLSGRKPFCVDIQQARRHPSNPNPQDETMIEVGKSTIGRLRQIAVAPAHPTRGKCRRYSHLDHAVIAPTDSAGTRKPAR